MKHTTIWTFLLMTISILTFGQSQNLFRIVENDKIGYMDEKGNTVIAPVFLNANDFSEGLASARLNSRFGFIDHTGQFIIQPKYEYALNFKNGYARVYLDGKPLYINKHGKVVVDTCYYLVQLLDNNKAVIQTKSYNQGMIDLITNKLVIDTIFSEISYYENNLEL